MKPFKCFAVMATIAISACSPQSDSRSASLEPTQVDQPIPATTARPDNRMAFIATFEPEREAPSSQVFGALAVEGGCIVFRSRDENRTFLALLPSGTTLSGSDVRLGGDKGVAPLGSAMMFDGGRRPNPGARVGSCLGDHMVLARISERTSNGL